MFSREIRHTHYRTPRTIHEAFGAYAQFDETVRHPKVREAAEWIGYIVAGLILGGVISSVMYGAYKALGWAVTQ